MRGFLATILAVLCAVVLFWGQTNWNKRNVISGNEENQSSTIIIDNNLQKNDKDKKSTLMEYTENWPSESRSAFKRALDEKRQFKILLLGSPAIGSSPTGWAYITQKGLISAYGDSNLRVEIKTHTTNTMEFTNNNLQNELVETGAELIIFEPFLLTDNGSVKIEDSLEFIEMIIEDVNIANPETVFLLQPPNPIYSPKYYDTQVKALAEFAEDKNLPYLNHWEVWPDPASEEIKNYLDENTNLPNEQGHKIWADFILDYFISK